jgi:hypothetical protein
LKENLIIVASLSPLSWKYTLVFLWLSWFGHFLRVYTLIYMKSSNFVKCPAFVYIYAIFAGISIIDIPEKYYILTRTH